MGILKSNCGENGTAVSDPNLHSPKNTQNAFPKYKKGDYYFTNKQIKDAEAQEIITYITNNCPDLDALYLGHNEITKLDVSGLGNLTNLSLYDNNLTEIENLNALTSLTKLDLGKTAFTSIIIPRLDNLTTLGIDEGTSLTSIEFNELPKIQSIDLKLNTNLTNIAFNNDLTSLKILDLNTCSSLTSLDVTKLSNLDILRFGDNSKSAQLDVSTLSTLTELEVMRAPNLNLTLGNKNDNLTIESDATTGILYGKLTIWGKPDVNNTKTNFWTKKKISEDCDGVDIDNEIVKFEKKYFIENFKGRSEDLGEDYTLLTSNTSADNCAVYHAWKRYDEKHSKVISYIKTLTNKPKFDTDVDIEVNNNLYIKVFAGSVKVSKTNSFDEKSIDILATTEFNSPITSYSAIATIHKKIKNYSPATTNTTQTTSGGTTSKTLKEINVFVNKYFEYIPKDTDKIKIEKKDIINKVYYKTPSQLSKNKKVSTLITKKTPEVQLVETKNDLNEAARKQIVENLLLQIKNKKTTNNCKYIENNIEVIIEKKALKTHIKNYGYGNDYDNNKIERLVEIKKSLVFLDKKEIKNIKINKKTFLDNLDTKWEEENVEKKVRNKRKSKITEQLEKTSQGEFNFENLGWTDATLSILMGYLETNKSNILTLKFKNDKNIKNINISGLTNLKSIYLINSNENLKLILSDKQKEKIHIYTKFSKDDLIGDFYYELILWAKAYNPDDNIHKGDYKTLIYWKQKNKK